MLPIAYKRLPAASERLKRGCVFARRRAMEPGRGALFFVLGPWSTQIRCTECRFGSKFMQKQGMAYRVLVFQARWKANRIARCFRLCLWPYEFNLQNKKPPGWEALFVRFIWQWASPLFQAPGASLQ